MSAVLLAILSSIGFGASDFLGGMAAKRTDLLFVMAVNQFAGLLTAALAAYLLGPILLTGQDLALSIAAGLASVIGIPTLYRGLAIGPMSIVAPATALVAILLPVAYGMGILGEAPGWLTLLGFALGGFAVFLLGGGDKIAQVIRPVIGAPASALRGLGYALAAGTCIAVFYIVMKHCSPQSGLWPLAFARCVTLSLAGALVGLRQAMRPAAWPRVPMTLLILLSGFLDSGSNALYVLAVHRGALGVVSTIASLYPAVTILLARYALGERISLPQALGVACALGAILAIIWGLQLAG
jgi:drug/metabolite transporter (DMT)-like permease